MKTEVTSVEVAKANEATITTPRSIWDMCCLLYDALTNNEKLAEPGITKQFAFCSDGTMSVKLHRNKAGDVTALTVDIVRFNGATNKFETVLGPNGWYLSEFFFTSSDGNAYKAANCGPDLLFSLRKTPGGFPPPELVLLNDDDDEA